MQGWATKYLALDCLPPDSEGMKFLGHLEDAATGEVVAPFLHIKDSRACKSHGLCVMLPKATRSQVKLLIQLVVQDGNEVQVVDSCRSEAFDIVARKSQLSEEVKFIRDNRALLAIPTDDISEE